MGLTSSWILQSQKSPADTTWKDKNTQTELCLNFRSTESWENIIFLKGQNLEMADSGCQGLGMGERIAGQHWEGAGCGLCLWNCNVRGTFSVSTVHCFDSSGEWIHKDTQVTKLYAHTPTHTHRMEVNWWNLNKISRLYQCQHLGYDIIPILQNLPLGETVQRVNGISLYYFFFYSSILNLQLLN